MYISLKQKKQVAGLCAEIGALTRDDKPAEFMEDDFKKEYLKKKSF